MTRIYTTIQIPMPIETVFDYVTTPGNWPKWHPSSLAVSVATDHSLDLGEQVLEEYLVAKRHGKVTWTVRDRTFPHHWVIEGEIEGSAGTGMVAYTLSPRSGGTFFEREFVYTTPSLLLAVLDTLILRRRIKAESTLALQQLKAVLTQQNSCL